MESTSARGDGVVQMGTDANLKVKRVETALHYASGMEHLSMVKELVERGADVNLKDDHG
jgi:ankyrin repeat protein